VHMSRTILISGVYCSLETPARSAAEYPHHVQQNVRILGTNIFQRPLWDCWFM